MLADVARLAGVSPITASRVVNGGQSVSEATRARVLEAIDALGYRGNAAARALAGGRSRTIGVVGSQTGFYGPMRTLVGIEAAARRADHAVSFVTLERPERDEVVAALDRLAESHADGAIVIAPLDATVGALGELEHPLPFVVTSAFDARHAGVSIDQRAGARLATAHLLELGHRTVHHVAGPSGWHDASARRDGWQIELRSRRIRPPAVVVGDWTAESGYAAGRRLAREAEVTAVFAANDQMALGVLAAMREAGRDVPGDVSVVGFDDIAEAAYFAPALTTIRQDLAALGTRSVEMLLAVLAGEAAQQVEIAPELVVRRSAGPPS